MFVNGQDTTLLHGALRSAVTLLESNDNNCVPDKRPHLTDKLGAANIVSSTVIKLIRDASKVNNEMEFLEMQLKINRRLHAAIFFAALKDNGITCTEANNYFESVSHIIPSMNWKFYLKLNSLCNWSEYFIECARQLPADILASVIKAQLACLGKEDDLKPYTWHLALQSIVWKFFHLEDSSIIQPLKDCPFNFPFSDLNATDSSSEVIFSDNPANSKLLHTYITILNHMIETYKTNQKTLDFTKVILHFIKTTFKLLPKVSTLSEKVKPLFRMNVLFKQCLTDENLRSAIKAAENAQEYFPLDHCYVTTSWEISENYLLFLICNYLKDVEKSAIDGEHSFHVFSSPEEKQLLLKLCPLYKEDYGANIPYYFNVLKTILRYNYPFASRAAEILLMHPDLYATMDVANTLKEHSSKLCPSEIYPFLTDAIMDTCCAESTDTFLNLFYQLLSQSSDSLYDDALKYILRHYGVNEHFKLPVTDSLLVEFTRKTMLIDEAEKFLLPLFIQLPEIVLKTVIEQALLRGAEGIAIIPVLKKIPSVCFHQNNTPLVKELSRYFLKTSLETYEEKNLVNLIESIMEVQVEKEIISFDKFLKLCIFPSFSKNIRVDLTLECLNVSLKVLTSEAALNISDDSFFTLINCLTSLTNSCVLSGNGKRKELILLTLSLLSEGENLIGKMKERHTTSLEYLSSLDEIVHIYFKSFYGKELYQDVLKSYEGSKLNALMWTYCCHSKDLKMEFKNKFSSVKISYEQVLSVLIELLFHFTKEEWIQTANMLKEYFEHFSTEARFKNLISLLPKSDPQLYSVIRTLMDCYSSVLKVSSCDIQYVTSCFTNTVMGILNQECHPQLLVNVFLDACHLTLINDGEIDLLYLLSSLLMNIQKRICQTCEDKTQQENYLKLTLLGAKCLPESNSKTSLLQKIQ